MRDNVDKVFVIFYIVLTSVLIAPIILLYVPAFLVVFMINKVVSNLEINYLENV